MQLRLTALWACLLCASVSYADRTYTVREGDTLAKIAKKVGVPERDLIQANAGVKPSRLQIGQSIRVPSQGGLSARPTSSGSGGYTVRNGDHDWLISRKLGISVSQLHALNPGVRWTSLQIGQQLRVPGSAKSAVAAQSPASRPVVAGGRHIVQKGENDWIIARKHGTTPATIHRLNPNVNWSRLQPGQAIAIPGSSAERQSASVAIRTGSAQVRTSAAIIRSSASSSSRKLGTASKGSVAKVLDRDGGWYKLRFPEGTTGWVRGDLLAESKAVPLRTASRTDRRSRPSSVSNGVVASMVGGTDILNRARQLLGVRYRYGGSSRSGFDCSGFVSHVYRSAGVSLPRTASEQSRVGRNLGKSELQKGDLVFFKTNRGTRINHVGIYIGGGRFIHASSGGGQVKTDTLESGYYQRRYAGARRVASSKKSAPKEEPAVARENGDSGSSQGEDAVAP